MTQMLNKDYYKLRRDFNPRVVPSVDFVPGTGHYDGTIFDTPQMIENEPYPDPFGVPFPLAQADEEDMKGKDVKSNNFLKQFIMNQGIA